MAGSRSAQTLLSLPHLPDFSSGVLHAGRCLAGSADGPVFALREARLSGHRLSGRPISATCSRDSRQGRRAGKHWSVPGITNRAACQPRSAGLTGTLSRAIFRVSLGIRRGPWQALYSGSRHGGGTGWVPSGARGARTRVHRPGFTDHRACVWRSGCRRDVSACTPGRRAGP